MVQLEFGNDENKSRNYDKLRLFHSPYLIRVHHEFSGTFRMKRKRIGWRVYFVTWNIERMGYNGFEVLFRTGDLLPPSSQKVGRKT